MINMVYHSSPDYIESFDFSRGVHFGGIFSSYEAGLRKLKNLQQYQNLQQDYVYVYSFNLKNVDFYLSQDVGNDEEWQKQILIAKELGYKGIKYKNLYEPDLNYSYLIFDSDVIESVGAMTMTAEDVEEELNIMY